MIHCHREFPKLPGVPQQQHNQREPSDKSSEQHTDKVINDQDPGSPLPRGLEQSTASPVNAELPILKS